jgi:hypothetical protein
MLNAEVIAEMMARTFEIPLPKHEDGYLRMATV